MLTFFQNQFTSFSPKKIGLCFAPTDDGANWLQQAEQKRAVFSAKIETAKINPKAKEKFRREAELVLQKNNPLEHLHDLDEGLRKYEEFVLAMRTNFLYKRDGFLTGEFDRVPIWGGARIAFENESLPSEVVAEKIFWLHEFVEPLYDEQIDPTKIAASELSATAAKMTARMQKIKLEAEQRKKQIADFLAAREQHPALAMRFKKLFSKDVFARGTFEERSNILLRIGDQIRATELSGNFLEIQENDFANELEVKIETAKNFSLSDAWVELHEEEMKLLHPPRQIKKLEIFKIWVEKFRAEREKIENKIVTHLAEVEKHLAEKTDAAVLRKDLEFIAGINPRFKLEARIKPALIPLELKLLAKIQKNSSEKTKESTSSVRENLFLAQKNNDFVRRMFIQIAALTMAMGRTSTVNETQKQLVKQDAVECKNLQMSAAERLKQTAAEKTTRQIRGAETVENVDTLSAAQNTEAIRVRGAQAEIREDAQLKFQTDSWEMTRMIGIKAWPPHELQEYLQTVRRLGHRLELTDNYLSVSPEFAPNLLRQRVTANLSELPGKSAREKENYRKEFLNLIDGAQKADDGFVDLIFSYTPKN